jgi:hypothetical protein
LQRDSLLRCSASAAGAPATPPPSGYTYVHHPVSTDIPAAQLAFDRRLTLFFAYQPDEAEQAFRQAARLGPGLAHGLVGPGPERRTQY